MKPELLSTACIPLPHQALAAEGGKAGEALTARLSDKGVDLACGNMGTFTLTFPLLDLGEGKKGEPIEKQARQTPSLPGPFAQFRIGQHQQHAPQL